MALIGKVRKLYTWLLWDSHKSINLSCCSLNKTKRNKGHKVWAWVINLWSTSLAHLYGHMCSIIPIVNHQNKKIVNENTTSKPTAKYISTRKKLCWQFHMCVWLRPTLYGSNLTIMFYFRIMFPITNSQNMLKKYFWTLQNMLSW